MQELKKILEEIEKKQVMWPLFDEEDRPTGIINVNVVKGIIRKHLSCENDQETTRSPRDSCGECSRRKWYQIGYEDGKDTDVITKILTEMQEVKEIVLSPKDGDCFGVPCDGDDCLLCVVDKCIEIVQKHANDGWIPVEKSLLEEKCRAYRPERSKDMIDLFTSIQRIADHYGYDSQARQTIEELSELTQAICKHSRAISGVREPGICDCPERDAVIEEMADVTIMLMQIEHLLKIDGGAVLDAIEDKINRQLERMDQGEKAHS